VMVCSTRNLIDFQRSTCFKWLFHACTSGREVWREIWLHLHVCEISHRDLNSRIIPSCWYITLPHIVRAPAFYRPVSCDSTRVSISCRNADPITCTFCVALPLIVRSPAFEVTIVADCTCVSTSCRHINPMLSCFATRSNGDIALSVIIFT
jgi:hypothetical protein